MSHFWGYIFMSGNFTQRGDVALFDKWTRTEMALKNGIDLVIELPTVYATSSAENFANGAIKILNSLGIVDYLAFGSESGDITLLDKIATILYNEPKEFSQLINMQLRSGLSYPKARELAIATYFRGSKQYTEALESPNNILGIEYLKALKRQKSHIIPITIKRINSDYNSTSTKNNFASATAIRTMIKNKKPNTSKTYDYSNSDLGIALIQPVTGTITSRFGRRSSGQHTGLDIATSTGTPIVAAAGGTVTYSGYKGSYGNLLVISHGNGVTTYYAHCSKLYVSAGVTVAQGQQIAAIGNTGNSTGPHLHFEVRRSPGTYANRVNPTAYLP